MTLREPTASHRAPMAEGAGKMLNVRALRSSDRLAWNGGRHQHRYRAKPRLP